MADNTTLDAGAGGDVIAADDIGGVKYQRVKVTYGADGAATDVEAAVGLPVVPATGATFTLAANSGVDVGDVTINNASLAVAGVAAHDAAVSGNPVLLAGRGSAAAPVDASADGDVVYLWTTLKGAVNIADAGGSLTVDNGGTFAVQAAQSGTWNVGTVTTVTTVSTVTAVTDVTNNVKVVGPAAHDAAVSGAPVRLGAYAKAAAPTDVSADGDTVNLWADLAGRLSVWDGGLNLSIDDGGNVITVDGTVAVTSAGITTIAGAVSGTEMQVDVLTLPALPAGTNNIGDIDVLSIAAGDNNIGNVDIVSLPASTNTIEVVGDAAHDAAVAGNPLLVGAYASATIPAAVSADGDAARLWVHRAGLLPVTLVDAAGDAVSVGGGTQYAVQSAFGATSASTVAGVVRKDVAADLAGADGDVTALQVDSAGALRVTGGGGGTEYVVNAVAPADPTGATFVMERDDALSALTEVEGDWTNPRASANGALWTAVDGSVAVTNAGLTELAAAIDTELQVDVVGALPAGDNNIGNVDIVTMPNVTLAAGTNTNEVVGDAAHDAAVAGNPLLAGGYASAAAPADVSADGDAVRAWRLRNGAAATVLTAAGALVGGDAANGLDVDVTRLPALVAGTANIGDVDILTIAAGDNNIGNVDIVSLPASTNTLEVVGDVAHDAAAGGNPVAVAGVAQNTDDTAPPNRISAEGDATRLATDWDGAIFARPHGPQVWSFHSNGSSALTDSSVHASPGAGLSLYVTDIVCSSGAATAMNVFFEEGASTVLGPYYLEAVAGRGLHIQFQTPKKITADTALTVTTSAAIAHSVDVTGFVGRA